MRADWRLLSGVFIGVLAAATLAAAAPMYVSALERLGLDLLLDTLVRPRSNINAFAFNIHLTHDRLRETDRALDEAIRGHVEPIYDGRQRYLLADTYNVELPRVPAGFFGNVAPGTFSAYYRTLSDIEEHVTFQNGRMAVDEVEGGPTAPRLEAIVSLPTADLFDLRVGDAVVTSLESGHPVRVTAEIVGIVTPTDPNEDYWDPHPILFLDPTPFSASTPGGGDLEAAQYPPAPLFITQNAMVDGLGAAYPTSLIDSIWIILIDKSTLKSWGLDETQRRMEAFEQELSRMVPGSEVAAALNRELGQFDRRLFFSRVPLLLLMTVMVVTVLFYLGMISSCLAQSRAGDTAALRTRGLGVMGLLRLNAWEALVMAIAAVAAAPFGAMIVVSLSGLLPYLRDVTGGALLRAEPTLAALLAALAAGAVSFAVVVLPGVIGSRGGLLAHKVRAGRPSDAPFFQRYYMDAALVALGGAVFWELRSRGHLVSGGLFDEIGVNETLMLAPALFLLAAALVFMRLFPIIIRFLSGESWALVHVMAGLAVSSASAVVLATGLAGDRAGWQTTLALTLAVGVMYWATTRARMPRYLAGGLLAQAGLVYAFTLSEPLDPGDPLYIPAIGLIALVPAQIAARLLAQLARLTPVWLSMGLRQMARNPFQYTGLTLLIVLAMGVAVLATTVGGTLERNQEDRIRYRVAADIRVTDVPVRFAGGADAMKARYESIPGVVNATVAMRSEGGAAAVSAQLLALESREFLDVAWYRDDFSEVDFRRVMAALQSHSQVERVRIPDFAGVIGLWAKPRDYIPGLTVWAAVEDRVGSITAIPLGTPGSEGWTLLSAELPSYLRRPLHLVSVQISEPGVGTSHTPGQLLLDNIHARSDTSGQVEALEDFEGQRRWFPIVTATLSSERITTTGRDVHTGRRAGVFTFGKENHFGMRGFYQSPTGGPVPVVVSSAFARETFTSEGEIIVAGFENRYIPMVIRGVVDYFPTMNPIGGRFILSDLDNILGHLNIMGHTPRAAANELFIAESPGVQNAVKLAVDTEFRYRGEVHHLNSLLESARLDPLTTSGWKSMSLLVLGMTVLTAGLGYVTYLLAFSKKTRAEIGSLQAVGLSRAQLVGILGFEHLAIAAMGVGLGAAAGLQMSRLMVASVSFTETGQRAVPPFILVTDWGWMLPTYIAFGVILLAALSPLIRGASRIDLKAVARAEP